MTLTLNSSRIVARAVAALDATCRQADAASTRAISVNIYPWIGTTRRANGEIAASPRDIVDLGRLRDSQQLARVDRQTYRLHWGVEYALGVHEGVTLRSGRHLPPRRWTQAAIGGGVGRWDNPNAFLNFRQAFIANYGKLRG